MLEDKDEEIIELMQEVNKFEYEKSSTFPLDAKAKKDNKTKVIEPIKIIEPVKLIP